MAAPMPPLLFAALCCRNRRGRHEDRDDAFDMPEEDFRRHFRLSKSLVRRLCADLEGEIGTKGSTGLTTEAKVLCVLRFFATGSFQTSVGSEVTIRLPQSSVSRSIVTVAAAITRVGKRKGWVSFPATPAEREHAVVDFLERGRIPGVVGCVDGTLIAISGPRGLSEGETQGFMTRKGYYALNTMLVSDANTRILAIDPRRPGSSHDSFGWRHSALRRRISEQGLLSSGQFLLGDSGYPLEPWLMTPVAGHPSLQTAEGRYNHAHSSMRTVVERCIGVLKSRFRCLQRYRTLHYSPKRAAIIIAACAALHNLCLEEGVTTSSWSSDEDSDDDDDGGDNSSNPGNGHNDGTVIQGAQMTSSARSTLAKGKEVRSRIVRLFSLTRSQHTEHLRRVRRRLMRQLARQRRQCSQ